MAASVRERTGRQGGAGTRHGTGTGHVVLPRLCPTTISPCAARSVDGRRLLCGGTTIAAWARRAEARCPTNPSQETMGPGDKCFTERFPANFDVAPMPVVPPTRAVKTCPLGVMDPGGTKRSPPVVGIHFHIGGKGSPAALGRYVRPVHWAGRDTGLGRDRAA